MKRDGKCKADLEVKGREKEEMGNTLASGSEGLLEKGAAYKIALKNRRKNIYIYILEAFYLIGGLKWAIEPGRVVLRKSLEPSVKCPLTSSLI